MSGKMCKFAPEIAGVFLSLGSNAERKVRAARATMLPNGKASLWVTASATEKKPLVGVTECLSH